MQFVNPLVQADFPSGVFVSPVTLKPDMGTAQRGWGCLVMARGSATVMFHWCASKESVDVGTVFMPTIQLQTHALDYLEHR